MNKFGIAIFSLCVSFGLGTAAYAAQPSVMSARWTSVASVADTVQVPSLSPQAIPELQPVVITVQRPSTSLAVTGQPGKKATVKGCYSYPMYASGDQHVRICE